MRGLRNWMAWFCSRRTSVAITAGCWRISCCSESIRALAVTDADEIGLLDDVDRQVIDDVVDPVVERRGGRDVVDEPVPGSEEVTRHGQSAAEDAFLGHRARRGLRRQDLADEGLALEE